MHASYVLIGIFIGFMVGLTGVGGASLLTPILLLLGIHPAAAVGTDLFYSSITKFFGVIQHWKQKTIHFKLVFYLSIGSLPGSVLAILLFHRYLSHYIQTETVIRHSLGVILILAAAATLFRLFFGDALLNSRFANHQTGINRPIIVVIGLLFGAAVGLTSVGSGSLFAIVLLFIFNLGASELIGTDLAHGFLLVLVSGLLQAGLGNVNYLVAANLLIGSIPGVLAGSRLSAKIPVKPLRAVLSVLILISGFQTL